MLRPAGDTLLSWPFTASGQIFWQMDQKSAGISTRMEYTARAGFSVLATPWFPRMLDSADADLTWRQQRATGCAELVSAPLWGWA